MVAASWMPLPPWLLPTMSLLKSAWMGTFCSFMRFACAREPINPCSSPATVMKTSVASNSMPLSANARASSIDSTVPLPSSLAPGATTFGSERPPPPRPRPACAACCGCWPAPAPRPVGGVVAPPAPRFPVLSPCCPRSPRLSES